jgi:DNA-binding MarR family transcriptional regulator
MSPAEQYARISAICREIAHGRRLARGMAAALRGTGFSETEFRVLLILRQNTPNALGGAVDPALDQSTLAERLENSAAQVSSLVEKLQNQGLLVYRTQSRDRRRKLWSLTPAGDEQLAALIELLGRNHDDRREAA